MSDIPNFMSWSLAQEMERLAPEEIDRLPFGVIGLDPQGTIRLYNRTEAETFGVGNRPVIGKTFYSDVAPCMNNAYFKGLIDKARAAGKLDLQFTFIGSYVNARQELKVRVQSASDGGTWIFIAAA